MNLVKGGKNYMVKILSHDDLDGFSSAYLAYKYFNELGRGDEVEITTMNYNSTFDLDSFNKEDEVYILDYHIKPQLFKELQNKCLEVVWIDHHVSAIEEYEKYFEGQDNMSKEILGLWRVGDSATLLTYEWFYSKDGAPTWVKLVDAWDTWKTDSEYYDKAECLNIATQNDLSIKLISNLDENKKFLEDVINTGDIYRDYRDMWAKNFAEKYGFETYIEDLSSNRDSIYVLSIGNANSKFFGNKIDKYDYCITQGFDGEKWNISIYSNKEDKDCAKFAKGFGGGGHKGAAGFTYEGLEPLFKKPNYHRV